jgi:hypothetical protein
MMVIFLEPWVLTVRKTTARSLERGFDSTEGLLSKLWRRSKDSYFLYCHDSDDLIKPCLIK